MDTLLEFGNLIYFVLFLQFWETHFDYIRCIGPREYIEYAIMIPIAICIFPSVILNVHVLIKIAMV